MQDPNAVLAELPSAASPLRPRLIRADASAEKARVALPSLLDPRLVRTELARLRRPVPPPSARSQGGPRRD